MDGFPRRFGRLVFVVTALIPWAPLQAQRAAMDTLRIATRLAPRGDALRGAIMSVEESARVAGMLGHAIVLDPSGTNARARFIIADAMAHASPARDARDAIVLAVACDAATPRERTGWFSLCASAPGAARAGGDSVVAWDATLEKFGAAQLNDRYRARWHAPMTSDAWRGWLAAKLAWEAWLRGPHDPGALRAWLTSRAARFDGHQGAPLAFGADHHLQHPAWRVVRRGGARTLVPMP